MLSMLETTTVDTKDSICTFLQHIGDTDLVANTKHFEMCLNSGQNDFRVRFGLGCCLRTDSPAKIDYSVVVSGSIDALQPLRSI